MRRMQVGLLVGFLLWFVSWISIKADREPPVRRNALEQFIVLSRDAPRTLQEFINERTSDLDHREKIVSGEGNCVPIGSFQDNDAVPDNLFLLHYRYLGGFNGEVVLQNVKDGNVVHQWSIDLRLLLADLRRIKTRLKLHQQANNLASDFTGVIPSDPTAVEIRSPVMSGDMELFFHCGILSYTYGLDANSRILWKNEELAHHSLEIDQRNNLWTCGLDLGCDLANANDYREDAVLCIGPDGKTDLLKGLTSILKESDAFADLANSRVPEENAGYKDPYHLNDVQPVFNSSSHWDKGDVFLSVRNLNAVILCDRDTLRVKWYRNTGWLMQHDVTVLDDDHIAVFNNNRGVLLDNVNPYSNIVVENLTEGTTRVTCDKVFKSSYEGRQTHIGDGRVIVEANGEYKYLLIDNANEVIASFYLPYFADRLHAQAPSWGKFYVQTSEGVFEQLQ